MRRIASGWERVGWDDALDEAARRLHETQVANGRDAVGLYAGNPTVHNFGAMIFGPLFMRALRTRNRFSATSVDQLPHMLASYLMFGHQLLLPVPDIDRCRYMLMLGANPLASNGSLMTAPGIRGRLEALRRRGGKLVVVDPRRTETAKVASEHLFIRPGSDALLLASLVNVVLEKGARLGRLQGFTIGLSALRAAVSDFSPEATEPFTGVPAGVARRIADELLSADAAGCYGRDMPMAAPRAEYHHGKPGSRGRDDVHAARGGSDLLAARRRGGPRELWPLEEPRARPARVRRRIAGGHPRRGDPHGGEGADTRARDIRGKPGALDAERAKAR
jgi:anaerobic selenocysteine-containing dehydrogenase